MSKALQNWRIRDEQDKPWIEGENRDRITKDIRDFLLTSSIGNSKSFLVRPMFVPMRLVYVEWAEIKKEYLDDEGYFDDMPNTQKVCIEKIINAGSNFVIQAQKSDKSKVFFVLEGSNLWLVD